MSQKPTNTDAPLPGQPDAVSDVADTVKATANESVDQPTAQATNEAESLDDAGDISDNAFASDSREELIEKVLIAHEQIEQLKENYIRVKAETENIRRRSQNEIVSARKYAIDGFAQELLSVVDSLDRAARVEMDTLTEGVNEGTVVKMKEGLELTMKQMNRVLEKFGVTMVEASHGIKFNPEIHQAISILPSDEIAPEHILEVMQTGFFLKDRLLRPAMVVVATDAEK